MEPLCAATYTYYCTTPHLIKTLIVMKKTKHKVAATTPKSKVHHTAKKGKFDPVAKAKNALKTAKYRCENPNSADYKNYGNKGIKFLANDFGEFVTVVGLPTKKGVSLDRIDPNGHYEVSNLRWETKKVQALNKKKIVGESGYDIYALAHAKREAENEQAVIDRQWEIAIRAHNRGHITSNNKAYLDSMLLGGALKASYSYDGTPPYTFELPSLTCPAATVRLRGANWVGLDHLVAVEAEHHGVIRSLGSVDLLSNVASVEFDAVRASVSSAQSGGLKWVGNTFTNSPMHYPVEGRMLALASNCYLTLGGRGAFYPVRQILRLMEESGWNWLDELEYHPLLKVRALFIPDFQVDHGAGWQIDPAQASQLLKLLKYRRKNGLKTFMGVQRINRLPRFLAVYLAGNFSSVMIGAFSTPQHPSPELPAPVMTDDEPIYIRSKKSA